MVRSVSRTLVLAGLVAGVAVAAEAARVEERVERSLPASEGETLTVRNANGVVRVTSWDRDEVKVESVKVAERIRRSTARAELERVELTIERVDGGVSVEARLPRRSRGLRVDHTIVVPRRFDLDVRTSNGALEVREVEGRSRLGTSNGALRLVSVGPETEGVTSNGRIEATDAWGRVDLRTSNGRIAAEALRGTVSLRTSNGGIEVEMVELGESESLVLSTSNGSIRARLPRDLAAEIDATTSNGSIQSDFPVATVIRSAPSRNRLRGTIGDGGARVEARTTNGSIRLESR